MSDQASPPAAPQAPAEAPTKRMRFGFLLSLTLLGLLLLIWAILAYETPSFATTNNILNLLRQAAVFSVIAVGQTFVVITAGIDLSVGAVVGLAGTLLAMMLQAGWNLWLSLLLTLVMGVAVGWCHAFGIRRMGLPPFIMTLASLTALRGISLILTSGSTITIAPGDFTEFSRGSILEIPNLFFMVILVAIPAFILLHHSRWGRYIFAVGSNPEAARLSGVNVNRTIYLCYMISAGLAALAGIMTASRLGVGQPTTGDGWELKSIASTVIGGTSLFGAVGSIPGPLLGAMLLQTIANGANLLNVNSYWQLVITGGLIIMIVFIDQLRRPKR